MPEPRASMPEIVRDEAKDRGLLALHRVKRSIQRRAHAAGSTDRARTLWRTHRLPGRIGTVARHKVLNTRAR
jgi:hypothetical protein